MNPPLPSQVSHSTHHHIQTDPASYEVEADLDTSNDAKNNYICQWLGYGHEENTWDTPLNLTTRRMPCRNFALSENVPQVRNAYTCNAYYYPPNGPGRR